MLRQWQSTVPLSIEIDWNLKLKIATWPYNAIHSPTRTSRTGSWSSNHHKRIQSLLRLEAFSQKVISWLWRLGLTTRWDLLFLKYVHLFSHMRETRKSSAMPTCQCWVDSFILLLQYWYWNYLEFFGRDMTRYDSMIFHDEIYLDTCGNGWTWRFCMSRKVCIQAKIKVVFNAICKGYTSFNSKRCQNLPNLMSFLYIFVWHSCAPHYAKSYVGSTWFNFMGEVWQPGKIHGSSTLRIAEPRERHPGENCLKD